MCKVNKFFWILLVFFSCSSGMNEPDAYQKYQNIEGVWGKNNVYLIFSNETWECLFALDNIAPRFNGDEDYAYPDGFDSYDDYINDVNNQLLVASCEGNRGYFEILHNYVTLYDDNASYKLKYEINNGELKLMATNNNLLRIFYDKALYRPFNPELRSNANEDIFYNLNGIWIKR